MYVFESCAAVLESAAASFLVVFISFFIIIITSHWTVHNHAYDRVINTMEENTFGEACSSLVKKRPTFYGGRRYISGLKTFRHMFLSHINPAHAQVLF